MQLQKHMTNERTGISYTLNGDYYLQDLELPKEKAIPIGIWGQRHLQYIKEYKKVLYTILLTSGKLNSYLAEIDKQAEEMFTSLVEQMSKSEYISEQIKEENQLEWAQRMNNVRSKVIEIVNETLIYT